ncbi:CBM96 family carbohydrate-binding protein, partial [Virgisporangium aliadipatigenens]|uniref:CBM96 family carbohydrate-binding protein n=1 Tax=Virgisporangium aliadipatigenens TaxID=741659 RepID=UPI0019436D24
MTATAGSRKPVNRPSTSRMITRRVLPVVATSLALGGSVFLAGNAFAADATELKVTAAEDSYTSSARPTFTFGGSDSIVAGQNGTDRMAAFLKFTAPATPSGKALSKVELRLTRDKNPLPGAVALKKVAGTGWTQKALNAGNAPAVGATVGTATPAATAATVSFDLTSTVTSAGTYAFAVTATQKDAIARFASTEAATAASRPQLVFTYRSTPAATPSKPVTPPTTPTGPNSGCTVDAKLVPSCNILWGAAAGGFSDTPRDEALKQWEAKSGRTASIYHTYHR